MLVTKCLNLKITSDIFKCWTYQLWRLFIKNSLSCHVLPSVQEVVGRTSIGRQFPTSVDGRRRVRNESSVDGRKTTSARRRKQTSIWRPELTSRWRRISTVDRRLICNVITTVARRPFSTSILRPSSTSNWRPHLTGYSRSLLTWFSTGRFNFLLYFL